MSETAGYGTPQAATTQYMYDPVSLGPTQVIDPDGHVSKSTYDASAIG